MIRPLLPVLLPALLLAACAEPRFFAREDPRRLSDWNLFREHGARLIPREQTLVFAPANPLFADYAGKLRTMWLPDGARARLRDGELEFPVGSVLSKTFYYPAAAGGVLLDSAVDAGELDRRRHRVIETRLLARREQGWRAMVYVWNEDQTEAFLRAAGASVPASLRREAGVTDFVYFVPNENQCAGCHATTHPGGALHPLGAVAEQLTAAGENSGGQGSSHLQAMRDRGWLADSPAPQPAAVSWRDSRTSLDARARAYLNMHCGHCHNPDGAADTSALMLDGSHRGPLELGVCKTPVAAGGGAGELLYSIRPGAPERSILLYRMASSEPDEMMPELGRSLVHEEGVALIRDWIAAMAGDCPEPAPAFGNG